MSDSKMIKKWQWILLLAIAVVFVFLQFYNRYHWPEARIELKGEELKVLLAKTLYQQHQGLGGRDSLGGYEGMLFIYSYPAKVEIVMREMKFPIDVVWFNNGKVVDIAPNLPIEPGVTEGHLRKYYPRQSADLILELPAGWAERFSLKIGDRLKILNLFYNFKF